VLDSIIKLIPSGVGVQVSEELLQTSEEWKLNRIV